MFFLQFFLSVVVGFIIGWYGDNLRMPLKLTLAALAGLTIGLAFRVYVYR